MWLFRFGFVLVQFIYAPVKLKGSDLVRFIWNQDWKNHNDQTCGVQAFKQRSAGIMGAELRTPLELFILL